MQLQELFIDIGTKTTKQSKSTDNETTIKVTKILLFEQAQTCLDWAASANKTAISERKYIQKVDIIFKELNNKFKSALKEGTM